MGRATLLLGASLFISFLSPGFTFAFRSVSLGDKAPSISVRNLDGHEVKISFGESVAVLTFWREKQSFSREALKDLEQLKKDFEGKGIKVFAIAEGNIAPSSVKEVVRTLGLSYNIYIDSEHRAEERYGVIVFPSTGIVDSNGRLKFYLPSRNSNYREIVGGRLKIEIGLANEEEFEQRMQQIGETLGSERLKAEEHLKIGLRLLRRGKAAEAVQELSQALDLNPDLADAHLGLGYSYLDSGEIGRARDEFEKVLQRHPASPGARVGIGISEIRSGRLDKGIEILKKAVGLNPDPVRGYYELGRAYEKKGEMKKALHAYKWAVRKLLQGRR